MPLTHKQALKNKNNDDSNDQTNNTLSNEIKKEKPEDVLMIYDQMKDYLLTASKPKKRKIET